MSIELRKRVNRPIAVAMTFMLTFSLSTNVTVAHAANEGGGGCITKVTGIGQEIAVQYVPCGAGEESVVLPNTLTGVIEATATVQAEAGGEQTVEAAGPEVQEIQDNAELPVAGAASLLDLADPAGGETISGEANVAETPEVVNDGQASEPAGEGGEGQTSEPSEAPAEASSEAPAETPVESDGGQESDTPVAMVVDWLFPAITVNAEEMEEQQQPEEITEPTEPTEPAAEVVPEEVPEAVPEAPVPEVTGEVAEATASSTPAEVTATTSTEVQLTGVTWSIDAARSTGAAFDSSVEGAKFVYVPTITTEYEIKAELPTITVIVGTKPISPAFEQSVVVDGVRITVKADAGVLPEGATITARKATAEEEAVAQTAVAPERDSDKLVSSYTFDITLFDAAGNQIQPDTTKGNVRVSFEMEEAKNKVLDADVYHIVNNDAQAPEAEKLETEKVNEAVEAKTTGFSFYTVEFSYDKLVYVLDGDSFVPLSVILETLEIQGNVVSAVSSNEEFFYVKKLTTDCYGCPAIGTDGNYLPNENGTWFAVAVAPFETEELLTLTMEDGIVYEIIVTDDTTATAIENGGYPYAKQTTQSSVKLAVKLDGTASSYKWQWSNDNSTWNDTNSDTVTTTEYTIQNPTSGTWYRCVVTPDSATPTTTIISKSVQIVKPGSNWTRTYGSRYYVTNGTIAYAIDGSYFDVAGLYSTEKSYMMGTSYGGCWHMTSTSSANPGSTSYGSAPNAYLEDVYFAFDDDTHALYISPVLGGDHKSFSFGCDTMLGNSATSGSYSDSAALEAMFTLGGALKHVAMIGAASSDSADASDPAFVITPITTTNVNWWLGGYSSRMHYSHNQDLVHNTDSGMTMSWTNIQPDTNGDKIVKFKFAVGDVASTGALGGSVNYADGTYGHITGLEPSTTTPTVQNQTYVIEVLGESGNVEGTITIVSDIQGRIPLADNNFSHTNITGTVPKIGANTDSYDLRGKKIRIAKSDNTEEKKELTIKIAGVSSAVAVPNSNPSAVIKPSDVTGDTDAVSYDITTTSTSITIKSSEPGIQFQLYDNNNNIVKTWQSPVNGVCTFDSLDAANGPFKVTTKHIATASDPGSTESEKSADISLGDTVVVTIPDNRVSTYNGTAQTFLVTTDQPTAKVYYSTSPDTNYSATVPGFTNVGRYTIYYKAVGTDGKAVYGSYNVRINMLVHDTPVIVEDTFRMSCYKRTDQREFMDRFITGIDASDTVTLITNNEDTERYPDNLADLCTSCSYDGKIFTYTIGDNEKGRTGFMYFYVTSPNHTPYTIIVPVKLDDISSSDDREYPRLKPQEPAAVVAPVNTQEDQTKKTSTKKAKKAAGENDELGHPNIIDKGNIWGDMSDDTKQKLLDKMSETGGEIIETSNLLDKNATEDTDKIPVKEMPIGLIVGEGAVIVSVEGNDAASTSLGLLDARAVAKALLTEEQFEKVKKGSILEIKLEVKNVDDNAVPAEDKKVAEEEVTSLQKDNPNLTMGEYLDVSLLVRIDDGEWSPVTESDPLDIVMEIPAALKKLGKAFYILRIHDGKTTLFEDQDNDPDTITVSSGLFSTYALVYDKVVEDEEAEAEPEVIATTPTSSGGNPLLPIMGIAIVAVILLLIFLTMKKNRRIDS